MNRAPSCGGIALRLIGSEGEIGRFDNFRRNRVTANLFHLIIQTKIKFRNRVRAISEFIDGIGVLTRVFRRNRATGAPFRLIVETEIKFGNGIRAISEFIDGVGVLFRRGRPLPEPLNPIGQRSGSRSDRFLAGWFQARLVGLLGDIIDLSFGLPFAAGLIFVKVRIPGFLGKIIPVRALVEQPDGDERTNRHRANQR